MLISRSSTGLSCMGYTVKISGLKTVLYIFYVEIVIRRNETLGEFYSVWVNIHITDV